MFRGPTSPGHESDAPKASPSPAIQPDPYARRWLIMAAVGIGTFLNVLDMSMLNVSLPVITQALGTNVSTIQWVLTGYLLVISSLLLTAGRLADFYGRKRVYTIGMLVFIVASVLCGIAQSVEQLIVFRLIQGAGSAFVQGVGPAITTSAFPASERGKALGIHSTTVALGGISGPLVGGLIADWLGWRWIFFLRIPLSLIVVAVTILVLAKDRPDQQKARFDIAGSALLFITLASFLLALNQGRFWGWGSPAILGLFGLSCLTAVVFVMVEMRVPAPTVPFRIFRNRLFAGASLSSMFSFMGTTSSFFLMPFYLQLVLDYPPSQAGLLLVPSMVMMSVFAPLSGTLSDRFGSRLLSPIGLAMIVFALFQISRLDASSTPFDIVIRLGLMGMGMGTFLTPNNSALMGSAPRDLIGLASGIMASMRNLGNVLGVAVASTVLSAQTAIYSERGLGETQAFLGGFHDAFLVAALFATFGFVASLTRGAPGPTARTATR